MKVYWFLPPDGIVKEMPRNGIHQDSDALTILNSLVKQGTLQGFLFLLNQEKEGNE